MRVIPLLYLFSKCKLKFETQPDLENHQRKVFLPLLTSSFALTVSMAMLLSWTEGYII